MVFQKMAAMAALAALAGCSAAACDPSQAGFLSGIGCEASGSYTQRNQAQQASLAQSRAAALQERAGAAQAQDEATGAQMALDERRRRLGAIDAQNATLRRRLATLQGNNRVNQAQLASAQAQLSEINRRRASLPAAPDPAAVRDLERQQQNLQATVRDLGNL